MTTPTYVTRPDGSCWRLGQPTKTSDGFLLATGVQVDPETNEPLEDDMGLPVIHSFFLGQAK